MDALDVDREIANAFSSQTVALEGTFCIHMKFTTKNMINHVHDCSLYEKKKYFIHPFSSYFFYIQQIITMKQLALIKSGLFGS